MKKVAEIKAQKAAQEREAREANQKLTRARAIALDECDELERATMRAGSADARRVLDTERVELMARIQRSSDLDAIYARAAEAKRVRLMWEGS